MHYPRSIQLFKESFFLFGPRQVGKSTILNKEKHALTIDLLNPEMQLAYNKNPNLLRDQIEGLGWQVMDTQEGPRIYRKYAS